MRSLFFSVFSIQLFAMLLEIYCPLKKRLTRINGPGCSIINELNDSSICGQVYGRLDQFQRIGHIEIPDKQWTCFSESYATVNK